MMIYHTHSKEETRALGRALAQEFLPKTLVTFSGDLGAGKTTLIQGLLEALGARPPYPSPTFVLMNEYRLPSNTEKGIERVYHADAYRVGATDFERLGFLEWCEDSAGIVLLEWPERLAEILPPRRMDILIETLAENERKITVQQRD